MERKEEVISSLKWIVEGIGGGQSISIEDADREQAFKPNGKKSTNILQMGYMTILCL